MQGPPGALPEIGEMSATVEERAKAADEHAPLLLPAPAAGELVAAGVELRFATCFREAVAAWVEVAGTRVELGTGQPACWLVPVSGGGRLHVYRESALDAEAAACDQCRIMGAWATGRCKGMNGAT